MNEAKCDKVSRKHRPLAVSGISSLVVFIIVGTAGSSNLQMFQTQEATITLI